MLIRVSIYAPNLFLRRVKRKSKRGVPMAGGKKSISRSGREAKTDRNPSTARERKNCRSVVGLNINPLKRKRNKRGIGYGKLVVPLIFIK